MDIENLEYFLELCQRRNITKAAENLHISQPALSRRIKGMEEELGVELFEKGRHYLEPTAAGKRFLKECETYMRHRKRLMEDLATFNNEAAISIGYYTGMSVEPLMNFLIPARRWLGYEFRLVHDTDKNNFDSFMSGGLKCLYTPGRPELKRTDLNILTLAKRGLSVIIANGHPLWSREYIELSELKEHKICLLNKNDRRETIKGKFLDRLSQMGIDFSNIYQCEYEEEALLYAACGRGLYLHGSLERVVKYGSENYYREIPVTGVPDELMTDYDLVYKKGDKEMQRLVTSINAYHELNFSAIL